MKSLCKLVYLSLFLCVNPLFASLGCNGEFYVQLQGLVGTAFVSNQEVAGLINSNQLNQDIFSNICIPTQNPHWSGGFKGALGYAGCQGNEFFKVEVTYLPIKTKARFCHPVEFAGGHQSFLISLWNPSFVGYGFESVETCSDINFVTVDFLAATKITTCSYVNLSPYFGVRALFLSKSLDARFENAFYVAAESSLTQDCSSLYWQDRNHAGGITAGISFDRPLFCGLSVYGKAGGSVVVGSLRTFHRINGSNLSAQPTVNTEAETAMAPAYFLNPLFAELCENNIAWSSNLEGELGLNYRLSCFCCPVEFGVSYLNSYWFDQNRMRNVFFTGNANAQTTTVSYSNLIPTPGSLGIQAVAFKLSAAY